MKRRVRKIANFFAFNLLFFALYLNFIHKDKVAAVPVDTTQTAAFSGTLVENQDQNSDNKNAISASAEQSLIAAPASVEPLRLSIN
jgi:hypothetical protein